MTREELDQMPEKEAVPAVARALRELGLSGPDYLGWGHEWRKAVLFMTAEEREAYMQRQSDKRRKHRKAALAGAQARKAKAG